MSLSTSYSQRGLDFIHNNFQIQTDDSFIKKAGKFSARVTADFGLAITATIETVFSAALTALLSPLYLSAYTREYITTLANHTKASAKAILNSGKGMFGYYCVSAPKAAEAPKTSKAPKAAEVPKTPETPQEPKIEPLLVAPVNFDSIIETNQEMNLKFLNQHKVKIAYGIAALVAAVACVVVYRNFPDLSNFRFFSPTGPIDPNIVK